VRSGCVELDAENVPVGLRVDLQDVQLGQERRQVASDDLAARPPERLGGGSRRLAVAAAELHAQERGLLAGQQQSPEDGLEGGRFDRRSCGGGDRLRDGVRLLGREPALLDRKGRQVAGRVHVARAQNPSVPVGRHEATPVSRHAGDVRPGEPRQRHDPVRLQRAALPADEPAGLGLHRIRARSNLDGPRRERVSHRGTGLGAEERERRRLGGH
jgi:hypothetical protein